MRGSIPSSPFRNAFRAALTIWELNGEHERSVEQDAPMETLSSITHLGIRRNCVPEAEKCSPYPFAAGLPFGFCVSLKKHALISRHSHYIYAKQYAQFMMVEAVLWDVDGAEHIEENRHEEYLMKIVKCRTVRGACTSKRASRID